MKRLAVFALILLTGCVTVHKTQTGTAPIAEAVKPAHPACPDGLIFADWYPRRVNADGSLGQVEELHGGSAAGFVFVKHANGALVCKKTPATVR